MGFAKKRVGKDGRARYTAVYLDQRGSERSAGTFSSEKAADRAWQQAEVELRQGRVGDSAPPAAAGDSRSARTRQQVSPAPAGSMLRYRASAMTCAGPGRHR
jgi:hypothetical protein